MGSECNCVPWRDDPCAFCRRSEDWRDTELTRLRSELEAARAMVPSAAEFQALWQGVVRMELLGHPQANQARGYLARVEGGVSNG
jgi:hypothetical protein